MQAENDKRQPVKGSEKSGKRCLARSRSEERARPSALLLAKRRSAGSIAVHLTVMAAG